MRYQCPVPFIELLILTYNGQLRIGISQGLETLQVSSKGILMENLTAQINRHNLLIMIVKMSAATIL